MAEELLVKIPPEKRWAITAKTLIRVIISRMQKTSSPFLGKDDGILSLLNSSELPDNGRFSSIHD